MGLTTFFTEAAARFGLNDFSEASTSKTIALLGPLTNSSFSWGGLLQPGQAGTVTQTWANGFTTALTFTNINGDTVNLTNLQYTRTDTKQLLLLGSGSSVVSFSSVTGASINAGNDTITGNSANNTIQGYGGNDRIDGGAGTDTALFVGRIAQYNVSKSGSSFVVSGPDGTDTLLNIERLRFDDLTVAYDTVGTAGQAYRLYQAAFNRTPDQSGLGFQVNVLDNGASLKSVAQNFLNSPEFSRSYGGLSDSAFVTTLYQNVLHRAPDSSGLNFQLNALATGTDRAQLLVNFSESPENQAALIGVISNGMTYV